MIIKEINNLSLYLGGNRYFNVKKERKKTKNKAIINKRSEKESALIKRGTRKQLVYRIIANRYYYLIGYFRCCYCFFYYFSWLAV